MYPETKTKVSKCYFTYVYMLHGYYIQYVAVKQAAIQLEKHIKMHLARYLSVSISVLVITHNPHRKAYIKHTHNLTSQKAAR